MFPSSEACMLGNFGSAIMGAKYRFALQWAEYSLEGLMLKLKLQCFGHLMRRTDSFEKTLMLGKTEGGRRKG